MASMTKSDIAGCQPEPLPSSGCISMHQARQAMRDTGCWNPRQQMGRRWPIGCVALEITQRCNLDCTLCYLSEHSEATHDLPLPEILRRVELIYKYYGRNTDVQITGGEPTLRNTTELLSIVRRVRELGMRPTLMTNGRRATRLLLQALAEAGLMDVAFHIDTTQNIRGYATEIELNALRRKYLERARGLPLSVFFNTTVHAGNFHEIPDLVRFFKQHADRVRTASFQLQADTGRGIQRKRGALITLDSVTEKIQEGAETQINFTGTQAGHPSCNRYGLCLAVNGRLYDLLDDDEFIGNLQTATAHLPLDRIRPHKTAWAFARWLFTHPQYLLPTLRWASQKMNSIGRNLIGARGQVHTLSFFLHNFMDADGLDPERIHACVFKTMTGQGPLSMCLHNAKRDALILQPVPLNQQGQRVFWQPLTGHFGQDSVTASPDNVISDNPKHRKGRARVIPRSDTETRRTS